MITTSNSDHWFYALAQQACDQVGLRLYETEYLSGGKLWRVYISHLDQCTATIDDCIKVDRILGEVIEQDQRFPEHVTLEVSSPGLERYLTQPWHYQLSLGSKVKLVLWPPSSPDCTDEELALKRQLSVTIHEVNDKGIIVAPIMEAKPKKKTGNSKSASLSSVEKRWLIDFKRIKSAQVQLEF